MILPALCHLIASGVYHLNEIRRITRMLAVELEVKGLMNLQLALKDGEI